jgi:hypothetical protein
LHFNWRLKKILSLVFRWEILQLSVIAKKCLHFIGHACFRISNKCDVVLLMFRSLFTAELYEPFQVSQRFFCLLSQQFWVEISYNFYFVCDCLKLNILILQLGLLAVFCNYSYKWVDHITTLWLVLAHSMYKVCIFKSSTFIIIHWQWLIKVALFGKFILQASHFIFPS